MLPQRTGSEAVELNAPEGGGSKRATLTARWTSVGGVRFDLGWEESISASCSDVDERILAFQTIYIGSILPRCSWPCQVGDSIRATVQFAGFG